MEGRLPTVDHNLSRNLLPSPGAMHPVSRTGGKIK